jgi:hypothetical protein
MHLMFPSAFPPSNHSIAFFKAFRNFKKIPPLPSRSQCFYIMFTLDFSLQKFAILLKDKLTNIFFASRFWKMLKNYARQKMDERKFPRREKKL